MAAPPKAHAVTLGYLKADTKALDENRVQDPFTFRALYLCNTEADLPTATDWPDIENGDWAFARDEGTQWKRAGGSWVQITGGSGAPTDADYLVGTANGTLSAEIVVGTAPGGELGGTWASPTVDATHSGSAHHAQAHAIDGADHTGDIETAQIANDAVTYAKIQNTAAASRLIGRGSAAGAGDVEEITVGAGLTMSGTEISSSASTPSFLTIDRWSVS